MSKILLTKIEAKKAYETLQSNDFKCPEIKDSNLKILRNDICNSYKNAQSIEGNDYLKDLKFAIALYERFESERWFTCSLASNYDFWRYISICVMPDIIYDRFGDVSSHYFDKNVRIYPATLYWYINMFKEDSQEKTYEFLSKPCFSTDTILQTIERTGSETNAKVLKEILHQYSQLDAKFIKQYYGALNIFLRKILILHMAKSLVIIPEIFENGIKGYVSMLFDSILSGEENDK